MGAGSLRRAVGGALLLAALLAVATNCSLHVHPVPGVSVHVPLPSPDSKDKND